jgi:2-dehydropantoate 2-reductase
VRVLVAGAGALGTCYAVLLAKTGAEVVVFTRPERAARLRQGLRVSGLVEASATVEVVTTGREAEAVDYLILATKTADTAAVLRGLEGVEVGGALSLQNGLAKDDALAAAFGEPAVIGAACSVGASLAEPGHAQLTMNVATWLGEPAGGSSERVARLAAVLRSAGLPSWSVDDIRAVEWYKLCLVLPGALVTALSRRSYAEMALHPELNALWVRLMRECTAVARANGAVLVDPPAAPWLLGSWQDMPDEEVGAGLREIGERQQASGERMFPSMAQDVLAGRRTEAEDLAGDLLRRAAERGVPAPALETCYRLVRGMEDGF